MSYHDGFDYGDLGASRGRSRSRGGSTRPTKRVASSATNLSRFSTSPFVYALQRVSDAFIVTVSVSVTFTHRYYAFIQRRA